MEGYLGGTGDAAELYDELDLEKNPTSMESEERVVNLEDEPVAKVLLPSLAQKKTTTIKINLQNPSGKLPTKPAEEKRIVTIQESASISLPPKRDLKNIDRPQELRRLYAQTVIGEDGKPTQLFWQERQRGFRIQCRACKTSCTSEVNLIEHANGRRHLTLLQELDAQDKEKRREELEEHRKNDEALKKSREEAEKIKSWVLDSVKPKQELPTKVDASLAPGEPVPPGFENEVKRVPTCQSFLETYKASPLIGLEYLVELMSEEPESSRVVCFLCDRRAENPMQLVIQNLVSHIVGTSHRLAYLKRHFSLAHEALQRIANDRERKTELGRLVLHVAANIEEDHGRLRATAVDKADFDSMKEQLRQHVDNDRHFSESSGRNYVELVNAEKKGSAFARLGGRADSDEKKENEEGRFKKSFSTVLESGRGSHDLKKHTSPIGDSDDDIQEIEPAIKRPKIEGALRDTSPISLSSDSISLSSSNSVSRNNSPRRHRQRSRSPERYSRHGGYNRYTRGRYVGNGRHRYDKEKRSKSPPFMQDRPGSPSFRRSRSPGNRRTRRRSRSGSPRPRRRERPSGSPVRNSRSPSIRSKSPTGSQTSSLGHRAPWMPSSRGGHRNRGYRTQENRESPARSPEKDNELSTRTKWANFRTEADALEVEMESQRQAHKQCPEKHPLYNEEWKKFWNRRYKEVQADGRDPSKHDYKPEWIPFWESRMEELHLEEFKRQKEALKRKFKLDDEDPPEAEQKFKPRTWVHRANPDDPRYGYASRDTEAEERGTVADVKDTWKALTGGEIQHETSRPRRPSPPTRARSPSRYQSKNRGYNRNVDEESHKIIAVLRLLTALENLLGSFGPRVNSLLAQALAMEKQQANSSEDLTRNMDNIVLLESIREKFRGSLMAGIVERGSVQATRLAIANISELIARAPPPSAEDPKPRINPRPQPSATVVAAPVIAASAPVPAVTQNPVAVPGVGTIDRTAIALQLTEALIAQGKTDISEAELEELINAVIGMAQETAKAPTPAAPAVTKEPPKPVPTEEPKAGVCIMPSALKENKPNALEVLQATYKTKVVGSATEPASASTSAPSHKEPPLSKRAALAQETMFEAPSFSNVNDVDNMCEADLKQCLRIFSELPEVEQRTIVMFLQKLENTDPKRVEKLRKYVNSGNAVIKEEEEPPASRSWKFRSGPSSPFLSRQGGGSNPYMVADHDSDEDYSFDDVCKAATRNVEAKRRADEAAETKKREELLAKMKNLSKPADNNAIKQAIEATTDTMMAGLRELSHRKSSPVKAIPGLNEPKIVPKLPFPLADEPVPPSVVPPRTVPMTQPTTQAPTYSQPSYGGYATQSMPGHGSEGYGLQQNNMYGNMSAHNQYNMYPQTSHVQYPGYGAPTGMQGYSDMYYQQPQQQYQPPQGYGTHPQAPMATATPTYPQQPHQDLSYHPAQFNASYEKRRQNQNKVNTKPPHSNNITITANK